MYLKVADLIREVFGRNGIKKAIKRAEVVVMWPQVVGSEVAKFTLAKSFKDNVLYVEVADSETATHLTMQRKRFLDAYQERFGVEELQDIRFRVGVPPQTIEEAKEEDPPIDAEAFGRMCGELGKLDISEDVLKLLVETARVMLEQRAKRHALGWKPCIICHSLSEGAICSICERLSKEAKVRDFAKRLSVEPAATNPHISEDERAVAKYLALGTLKSHLQELLPQAIAMPALKPQLDYAARCYLANLLNKSLGQLAEDDFYKLDVKVARILGYW
ncbi:MAG: DciA family protein [Deinococcales bacterium]